MVAIWYLLVLAPFVAIPILWWNYRRKTAQRDDWSGARWNQMVSEAQAGVGEAGNEGRQAAVTPAAQPAYVRRERLLDPAHTLLFFLLKNALPDHEVLPQVALARLLDAPAGTGGDLAQHAVDFVICSKAMQPVAAVDLSAQGASAVAPDFKTRCLAHAGIRYVRIVRTALPKRDAVRGLVLGG